MAIALPWFIGGDNTAPPVESPLHRLFGDYYQTYDLWCTDFTLPTNLFSWVSFSTDKIILPQGKRLLFERYTPFSYIDNEYFLKFNEWIKQWHGITEIRPLSNKPTAVDIQFPLLTNPCELTYLTLDRTIEGVNVYSLIQEYAEGEWTPKYPILANSLTSSEETGWDDIALQYLLADYWSLPTLDSTQAVIDDNVQVLESQSNIATTTLQFQTNLDDSGYCSAEIEPIEYILFFYPYTPAGLEDAEDELQNLLTHPNERPEWANVCSFDFIGVSAGAGLSAFVGDFNNYDAVGEDKIGWPDKPTGEFYFWGYVRRDSNPVACQNIEPTQQVSSNLVNSVKLVYESIDSELRYFYALSANHNYWGLQPTLEFSDGMQPCVYIEQPYPEDSGLNYELTRCQGESIAAQFYFLGSQNEDIREEFENIIYFDCVTRQTETVNRIKQRVITEATISERTRAPILDGFNLFLASSVKDFADNYWLANNGSELEVTMPDSIRMKEIHAALNAGFFGNGQEKTLNSVSEIYGETESVDLILNRMSLNEPLDIPYTSLVDYQLTQQFINYSLLGLHNLPLERIPTYQYFNESAERESEPEIMLTLTDLLVKQDFETQSKLGLWPIETYNYAKLNDKGEPESHIYLGISDLLGDTFALDTRASLLQERGFLEVFQIDNNLIEVAKAIGSPFAVKEVAWDYGTSIQIEFSGGAGLAQGIAAVSEQISDLGITSLWPESFKAVIDERLAAITML